MAIDWIPMRTNLCQCREVAIMAGLCQCDPDLIVGRLHRFWSWVDNESADGVLHGVDVPVVAMILRLPEEFFDALIKVGWLEQCPEGLRIPNWQRWFSRSSKTRLQTARRVNHHRQGEEEAEPETPPRQRKEVCNGVSVTEALQNSPKCNAVSVTEALQKSQDCNAAALQKRYHRTEHNSTEIKLNDDVDDDVKGDKGGVGEKGDPRPLYRMHAALWPGRRVASKRDRVLLWRVATLAASGTTWAQVALQSLADARPDNPGAYLQKLVFELGPREPNVGLILAEIPVPAEVANPRPLAPGPPHQPAQPQQEQYLSREEVQATIREAMALVRQAANGTRNNGDGKHP